MRELRPQAEVCRGEAGGGDDGGDLKKGIAQALERPLVQVPDVEGDDGGGQAHHHQEKAQLIALKHFPEAAAQQQEVHGEIDGEQQGEDGDDHLQHGVAIGAYTGIAVGEAAGARRGEGVDKRVVQRHAGQLQQGDLGQCHGAVDPVEDLGGLGLLGDQLGKDRARGFRLGEVVRTDAQGGEQSGEQHQHAHAAHPVGECPPEQDATGLGLDVGEDGGTGGSEAGHRLKQAVHKGGEGAGEVEGERPHHAGDQPDQAHGKEALPGVEMPGGGYSGQGQSQNGHQQDGQQEGGGVLLVQQGDRQRQEHEECLDQQDAAHQPGYQFQIHDMPPGAEKVCSPSS